MPAPSFSNYCCDRPSLHHRSAETFQIVAQVAFPWAVNYAVVRPGASGGSVAAVVGDDEVAQLVDLANGGAQVGSPAGWVGDGWALWMVGCGMGRPAGQPSQWHGTGGASGCLGGATPFATCPAMLPLATCPVQRYPVTALMASRPPHPVDLSPSLSPIP